jgi:PAS domain S-box-containing protein
MMKDKDKAKEQLINEVVELRQRVAELQAADAEWVRAEEEALQESEERYRLLAEHVTDVIWTMDMDLRFTYVSPSVTDMLGYSVEEVMAQTLEDILTPASLEIAREALAEALAVEKARDLFELELNRKGGSTVWTEVKMALLRDPDGQPVGILGVARDITERKEAEERLQESEEFLRSLFETMAEGVIFIGTDDQIVQPNPAAERILGLKRSEIESRNYVGPEWEILRPDGTPMPPQEWAGPRAIKEKRSVRDVEMGVKRPDGSISWINVSATPLIDEAGNLKGVVGAFVDITERKETEQALHKAYDELEIRVQERTAELAKANEALKAEITERKRAEEELRGSKRQLESRERLITYIINSIPTSLVVIDRGLHIVSANRNFLEKTRRKAETTLGCEIEEVFPHVLLKYTRLDQKVREVFRTGRSVEGGKLSYRAPGLPTRIYYYRLIPLKLVLSHTLSGAEGGVEGAEEAVENVLLLMDDVTEREQLAEEVRLAERHLASVVECANDVVVSMDRQGRIVTWNQAAERVSGLNAEQVKGVDLAFLSAAEGGPVMAKLLRGLARGESVQNAEVNLRTADGHEVPVAWSCSSMRDDAGGVAGIVAVGRDLTERRQLEAQLIQSAKIASLGVMAGGIAHELRNPLGIISAGAQLLLERPEEEPLRSECAEKIQAATQRASLIVENLLKFARPTGEQMKEIDLNGVLEETLALLAHQMALQKVTLRREFQLDLAKIYGNPDLLQQVFTNLILNARNAMPQGGTLTVATRATEAGQVEVQFSDTGRGIPREIRSKIFDPFFTTMPVGKGVGLGLSISYSIIQQHQGTIEVESRVGRGTTFTVRLPGGK